MVLRREPGFPGLRRHPSNPPLGRQSQRRRRRARGAQSDRRNENHGTAGELFAGHAEMWIARERHHHGRARLLHVGAEITEIGRAQERGAHQALRTRAHDHRAHPRIVETIANPHQARALALGREDRRALAAALYRDGGVRRRAGAQHPTIRRKRTCGGNRCGLRCIGECIR